jgi:hypothetical protein
MSCKLTNGDRVFLFSNGQYFVDGVGFMDITSLMKCELTDGYKLSIERIESAQDQNQAVPTKSSQPINIQGIPSQVIDPSSISPQDAIQMGGGNIWITILLLFFSFFGGGKLSKFLEIRDNNVAKMDELVESIRQIKISINDMDKFNKAKHEEIDSNLDRVAIAIGKVQEQTQDVDKNNQRLMSKYEILLSDDIPDLDEIIIRLQKIEKQYKDIIISDQIREMKKPKKIENIGENKLNENTQKVVQSTAVKRGRKNNATSV